MFALIVDSMWYFVEKNGRPVAWSKSLFKMQRELEKRVKAGEPKDQLDVVDSLGRNHLKIY